MTKLERLDALLRRDPQRAKVEILKHLDGDLVIVPRPASTGVWYGEGLSLMRLYRPGKRDTPPAEADGVQGPDWSGADGARTRDLRSDSAAL